jgi:hypothetical protein
MCFEPYCIFNTSLSCLSCSVVPSGNIGSIPNSAFNGPTGCTAKVNYSCPIGFYDNTCTFIACFSLQLFYFMLIWGVFHQPYVNHVRPNALIATASTACRVCLDMK